MKNDEEHMQQLRAAHKVMCKHFPVFKKRKPLALGIHLQLAEAEPRLPHGLIQELLRYHCSLPSYLERLARAQGRYNLDGTVVEDSVNRGHRIYAYKKLQKRKRREQKRPRPMTRSGRPIIEGQLAGTH